MLDIKQILFNSMKTYAGIGFNGVSYLTVNDDKSLFSIVGMGKFKDDRFADTGIIARIANDTIVIELDNNDKPLVDMLLQAGIPRDKIILAYQGEAVPAELEVIPQWQPQPNAQGAKLAFNNGKLTVEKTTT